MQSTQLLIDTSQHKEYVDVTPHISDWLAVQGIVNGMVLIRTLHTTTSIFINEYEHGFLSDLRIKLQQLIPENVSYEHDDFSKRTNIAPDERVNGFAHIQASLLGTQVLIPVREGKLVLGKWQSILFVELDGPRKQRTVEFTLI